MMVHLMPDASHRRRTLPHFLGSVQRYCLRYGSVHTTPDLAGVACWLPPGRTNVALPRVLRSGMATAALRLRLTGLGRMRALTSAMERDHHAAMTEPHWYLWLLGSEPTRARKGVGSRLLAPVLAEADATATPAYLDTHSAVNLGFYARHGFEPAVERVVDGLRYWGLRRDPRG